MAKETSGKKTATFEKHGGYPSGSKTVKELAPPPKGPGAGAKPASTPKK